MKIDSSTFLTMFPDVFGLLEIDDAERVNVHPQFCTPSQYSANIQNIGWFLHQRAFGEEAEHDRELVNHRAAHFHYHKRFKEASEEYKVLLGEYKHNRTHSVAVLDSLIRCALKTLSCPADDLLRYLHEYKQSILDYGDQLQYLTVAKEIYAYISCEDAPQKFVEVVCLLCATTGLPEHWLAFGERNLPNMGKNFHIGYVTRAIMLLERQIKGAHGFVVRAMEKKLKNCIDRLAEMECSDELIREARLKMGVDLISIEENVALCDDFRRPAHDCRLKSGLHMNGEDLKTLLMTFQEKFVWMFEGCSL